MNRRSSLKTLLVISAGAAFLPSCFNNSDQSGPAYKNLQISNDEMALLSTLSDTILPQSRAIGSKDIAPHLFALTMIDDCFSPEDRKKFLTGMNEFQSTSKEIFGKSFLKCTLAERAEMLKAVQQKNDKPDEGTFFYNSMRRLTIQAYTTSAYYLTNVKHYKLVPGKFYGCVPVKKAS